MRTIPFLLLGPAALLLALPASAQPQGAMADALMQLMQSQPPVDVGSPVVLKTEFDPPFIAVGGKSIYRVSLNALEASVPWPSDLPVPEGLKLSLAARGQVLIPAEGQTRPQTSLNFHVQAERPGFYTLPAFTIEVYGKPVRVPEARLQVVATPDSQDEYPRQLILQPLRTNVFVGETLRVRVLSPALASNLIEQLTQLQFNGEGFAEDKWIYRQHVEEITLHGRRALALVLESSVTALAAGRRTLAAQGFTSGRQLLGPTILRGSGGLMGGAVEFALLDSDPVVINVQPLPPEGPVKGFTGFVGRMTVDRPQLSANEPRLGEVVTLRVTFRSEGSLARFTPPPAPRVAGWQVFPPTPTEPGPSTWSTPHSAVAFSYSLIPTSEDVRQTPAIPFRYFDPGPAAYVDATIPAMDVTVGAGELAADWKPLSQPKEDARPGRKASLSEFAASPGKTVATLVPLQLQGWFGLLQLAPALGLASLWYWDRRRRFLEAHPEVVRCREARRALRRERRALRRAAASGDTTGFVRRAVSALQIAAAPHFPAAPRALVCGEVLSLFDTAEQGGRTGEVIRSFFARDAEQTFSARPEGAGTLLNLRADLEGILERMEARL